MRLLFKLGLVLLATGGVAFADCPDNGRNHPAVYASADIFEKAIHGAPGKWGIRPTGLTVPHHLLAADLMADGISRAKGHEYDRVILLFPDHFRALDTTFGTLSTGFDTVLGPISVDPMTGTFAIDPQVTDACALADDHGLRALLPFVAEALPDVPVLPVAISIKTDQDDWERLTRLLTPLVTEKTLILQSTDFSHYLPHYEARQRDQETLNVLAAGDLDALAALHQPDHIDSAGAMYVQMALQDRVFEARPVVLANTNSQIYSPTPVAQTTSYVVAAFTPIPGPAPGPVAADRLILGGDTFFGRAIARQLPAELASAELAQSVARVTAGLPLILNLEGVLLPDMPDGLPHLTLGMPAELATDWLVRFGTIAVSLANNHAGDFGASGVRETQAALSGVGIPGLPSGAQVLRPGMALTALSDFHEGAATALREDDLDAVLVRDPARASIAFLHWGREFETTPGAREMQVARQLQDRGVSVIIGAHPHRASAELEVMGGGETLLLYSLGNFLFDQPGDVASGALAELSVFPQGTVFVQQHALPNLFDQLRGTSPSATPEGGNKTK